MEREFRRKERAKAQKEAEVAKSMSEARVLQMADIQRQQATQAAREEQEFMRLLEHLKAERAVNRKNKYMLLFSNIEKHVEIIFKHIKHIKLIEYGI